MKIEVSKEEIDLLKKLNGVYFFGLFQKLGIAKSKEQEYYYRDLLEKLANK